MRSLVLVVLCSLLCLSADPASAEKRVALVSRTPVPTMTSAPPATTEPTADALSVLNSVFGLSGFRGAQEAVVRHVTDGGNCLVLMPTGGGKSLCYQLPALLREGCGVVVSPLIALMRDQVAALEEAGVKAAVLNSTLAFDEAAAVEARLVAGVLDLLYVAPERLLTPRCLGPLDRSRVALFAIDEAHCVSQWGHDFRPEYIGLSVIAERFPDVPLIVEWPDVALPPLNIDHYTAFVALTHDPKIDDPALLHAFARDCFYIGALGSRKTHAKRAERLKAQGASESDIARIHAPIGLSIGAVSPGEIAVSIMAEITASLRMPKEKEA